MSPEQHSLAAEIALVALGLERDQREAYVSRRSAADPEVLAEVHRRLALADRIPEDFLDRPAAELVDGPEAEPPAAAAEPGELPSAAGERYRLAETLGSGGMGVVFRAFDQRLERPVAIKRLRHALAEDPQAVRRFEREARATAGLSHPAVVQVFDVLHDGDDLWIVMELVPGESLATRLARGPLALGEALSLAAEIADGLAAAHAEGLVHRDLKAANVMVTPEGRVKILDFGLARSVLAEEDSLTAAGGFAGTPAAMSPEQVSRAGVDARSDLFSFGALLYRMVTGESPFEGSSPLVTLERVCRFRPPPARSLNPRVPGELSALIEALLEKDPDRRPRSTAAVARTLARLAERASGAAAPAARLEAPALEEARAAFPSAAAERRQVTVLSCQLVAADASERLLEAQELLGIEEPFRELAGPVLDAFDANPGERLDGGFKVYFGIPTAREDDAHRAVSAALELATAVERWSAGSSHHPAVGLRAGVHTGPMVVATRPDGRRKLVLGRTGTCAAEMRLPDRAGAVLVSAATHRLVGDRFRFEALGACGRGCCSRPHEVYRVLAARPAAGDEGSSGPTAFVGREAELALLSQRWRQAGEGHGRVVMVSGEAGSGKSRLVEAFRQRLGGGPRAWLGVSSRPAAARSHLAERLSQALGCEDDDAGELIRRLVERKEGEAAALVIEDIHLADAAALDLAGLLIERASAARLLIVMTCRPPFEPPWKPPPHLTVCSLGPLTAGQSEEMIRHLAAGVALEAEQKERILASADGVPRFVEELTRAALRSEVQADDGEAPATLVPAVLRSGLTARLDRLGEAREVARAASVLGREFTRDQLSALVPDAGDAVDRGLDRLVKAEILKRRGDRRRAAYRFRYALDHAAAYESLLAEHRRLYEEWAGNA